MASSIHRVMVASALLLVTGLAVAREPDDWGPYVRLDLGATNFNVRKAALDEWAEIPAVASTLDRRDFSYSLAAGFRLSPHFAIEAAYLDLGRYSYRIEDEEGIARLGFGSRGPALSLIGTWPINKTWSLEGRAGAYLGKSKLRGWVVLTIDSDAGFGLEGSGGSNADFLLGAGVVASFGGNWALRLGYDYIDVAAAIPATDPDPEIKSSAGRLSLGIQYRF